MRYRSLLIALVTFVMVATLATVALAGKPEHPGKPTTTTTAAVTATTVPGYWTCQARIDNGAVWPLGTYDGANVYTGEGPALCVDIMAEHRDITEWTIEWMGTTAKGTVKGLKLVFEEEVHGTVYAETVKYEPSGRWDASLPDVPVGNLVFVVMPHQGDKWDDPMTFTIMPQSGG
jgi:hypothetical protein